MTQQGLRDSMGEFFRKALEWLAAGSFGAVIGFMVTKDIPHLLTSAGVAFVLCVAVVLRHASIRDSANAPPTPTDGHASSRVGFVAANALTFIRPALGIAAGIAISQRNVTPAFVLYLAALTTDVLDGMVARSFHAVSASGREWDAIADAITNFSVGFGLAWYSVGPPIDFVRAGVILTTVCAFIVSRFLVRVHSVSDKVLSAVWRVILYMLIFFLLPADWRRAALLAGAMLAVVGGVYEAGVIRDDIVLGRRHKK